MSLPITRILLFVIGCYGLIILVDLVVTRNVKRCLIEGFILTIMIIVLHVTTGFPTPKQAFGGIPLILAVGIMLVCTVLGMAARFVFYQAEKFSWGSFLRPLVIAPIILLPLIGTMQGVSEFKSIHLISFGMLSFQNGFFWNEVFKKIRKEIGPQDENKGTA